MFCWKEKSYPIVVDENFCIEFFFNNFSISPHTVQYVIIVIYFKILFTSPTATTKCQSIKSSCCSQTGVFMLNWRRWVNHTLVWYHRKCSDMYLGKHVLKYFRLLSSKSRFKIQIRIPNSKKGLPINSSSFHQSKQSWLQGCAVIGGNRNNFWAATF